MPFASSSWISQRVDVPFGAGLWSSSENINMVFTPPLGVGPDQTSQVGPDSNGTDLRRNYPKNK